MIDLETLNRQMDAALLQLNSAKLDARNMKSSLNAAVFAAGRFVLAVTGQDGSKPFTPEQLQALKLGAFDLWHEGWFAYSGYVLKMEWEGRVGISLRVERTS